MLKKLPLAIVFLVVSAATTSLLAQDNLCRKTALLAAMLNKYHVSPPANDVSFSKEVFREFLDRLDPKCLIFSQADLNPLLPYQNCLRESPNGDSVCWLVTKLSEVYRKKLIQTDSLVRSCLAKPLNFTTPDSVHAAVKSELHFAANEKERINRWGSLLKLRELELIFGEHESDSLLHRGPEVFAEREKEARRRLYQKEMRVFGRLLDHPRGMEDYVTGKLFDAFCNRFDPHTSYFNDSENRNFMARVSREATIFGLWFRDSKNGEAEIAYLTPGGAAWKSGRLHQGDRVQSVTWPDGKKVDLSGADMTEADQIINRSDYESMELSVRKDNGSDISVHLVRQLVDVDENSVTGYLLKGDKTVGYISLPGFYGGNENAGPGGVSNDVAREIHLLEKSGITGLILDLRNNGGGSENEARDLIGLFIDEGPLFILREKNSKPYLVKDPNRGAGYIGPLLVLVNGLSASASEITAACLQDYHRALIVGSPTFGKGVGQVVLPLDTNENPGNDPHRKESSGFIKVTSQRIYRVTGTSFQKTGVIPDILLPEPDYLQEYREEKEKWALEPDRTDKKVIFSPFPLIPVDNLRTKAGERMKPGNPLREIKELCDSAVVAGKKETVLQLTLPSFASHTAREARFEARLNALLENPSPGYSVSEGMPDDYSAHLAAAKEISRDRIQAVQDDIYIEEALHILEDLISTQKSKP